MSITVAISLSYIKGTMAQVFRNYFTHFVFYKCFTNFSYFTNFTNFHKKLNIKLYSVFQLSSSISVASLMPIFVMFTIGALFPLCNKWVKQCVSVWVCVSVVHVCVCLCVCWCFGVLVCVHVCGVCVCVLVCLWACACVCELVCVGVNV